MTSLKIHGHKHDSLVLLQFLGSLNFSISLLWIPLAANSVGLTSAWLIPGFMTLKLADKSVKNSPFSLPGAVHFRKLPRLNYYLLTGQRSRGRLWGSARRPLVVWQCCCRIISHQLGTWSLLWPSFLQWKHRICFPFGFLTAEFLSAGSATTRPGPLAESRVRPFPVKVPFFLGNPHSFFPQLKQLLPWDGLSRLVLNTLLVSGSNRSALLRVTAICTASSKVCSILNLTCWPTTPANPLI